MLGVVRILSGSDTDKFAAPEGHRRGGGIVILLVGAAATAVLSLSIFVVDLVILERIVIRVCIIEQICACGAANVHLLHIPQIRLSVAHHVQNHRRIFFAKQIREVILRVGLGMAFLVTHYILVITQLVVSPIGEQPITGGGPSMGATSLLHEVLLHAEEAFCSLFVALNHFEL